MHTLSSAYADERFPFGQSGATAFPPPCGGGTGRGVQQAQCLFPNAIVAFCVLVCSEDWLRARRFIATPLPVPPPQGGREPGGTHLRTSHNVPVGRLPGCVHALAQAGTH